MDENTASAYLGLIEMIKALIFSQDFKERHRQDPKDFTRKRILTFSTIVIFMLNMLKRSSQDELDEYFKLLQGAEIAERIVTKSAFTQARRKLKYTAFIELNRAQVNYFYDHFETYTWHGFRLVAIDGSMGTLPNIEAIGEHFGVWHPAAGGTCPKARFSQMYDVLNHITIDAIIAPKERGERSLAELHFAHLKYGDLALIDRGYHAFWIFALILHKKANFCARMPLTGWKVVEEFVKSGRKEQIVTLEPADEARKACQGRGLSTEPITVRLLRIQLNDEDIEVLATNLLDSQYYPHAIFKDLYHQRWPVEEDYKVMKSRIEIENWSGETILAIYQDFHAKVFTKNLTAMIAHSAQKVVKEESRGKKYDYQVNMTNALSKMKDAVVLFLKRSNILQLLNRLWALMVKTIEPIRPERSFPREEKVKRKRFPVAYKGTR